MNETTEQIEAPQLPPGDYAIVELFGHTTLIGRITEVERFGTKMLALEPLYQDELLPPVLHGGTSIYRLTPCSPEVAAKRHPREAWALPASIRAILPAPMLTAPEPQSDWINPDDVLEDDTI